MSKSTIPQRWFTGWRSAPEAEHDDFADMGTAFGLDLSMDDGHGAEPAPVRSEPDAGWAQRLGLRRKPAA